MKHIRTVAGALLGASLVASCGTSGSNATDTESGKGPLTVGVRDGSPPFSSVNPKTGKPEGFEVDLANALSKAMGRKFELKTITGDSRIPMLQSHQIDLAIAVFTVTPERKKQVAFSEPYFPSPVGTVVANNSPIKTLKQLAGKKNCTPKGTINQQSLEDGYKAMFGPAKFQEVQLDSYQACVLALKQGRADMITTDLGTVAGLAKQDVSLRVLKKTFPGPENAIGIAKRRPKLVKQVNKALDKTFSDGTWKDLYLKWIGPPVPEGWPPAQR